MLQQYFRLKAEYPDVLLAMQVGDFYEFYGPDAEIAARELEIVLTGREDGSNGRIPMAGVPIHAYERYLAKLVQKGLPRRHLRPNRRPQTRQRAGQTARDARADPRHRRGRLDARRAGEQLPRRRCAGRPDSRAGRRRCLHRRVPNHRNRRRGTPAETARRAVPPATRRGAGARRPREADSDPARATKRDDYARTAAGMGRARGTRDSAAPFWGGVAARVRLRGVHARAGCRRTRPALPTAEPDDRIRAYPHAGDLLGGAVYVPRCDSAAASGTHAEPDGRHTALHAAGKHRQHLHADGRAAAETLARRAAAGA
jgi:hypothetical protein